MSNNLNILVTGSNGQLGLELRELSSSYDYNFYFSNRSTLDITSKEDIKSFVELNNINIIINCAAYTAVDDAEDNEILANLVNSISVHNLALISKEYNIKLIHISTEYVFDGKNYKTQKYNRKNIR
jgi:dTDP-4-dehydrorhamnose reductase